MRPPKKRSTRCCASRVGRRGNPLRVLAACWISRRSKATNVEVGKLIDMGPDDVSKAKSHVQRLRRAGGEITRLVDALEVVIS